MENNIINNSASLIESLVSSSLRNALSPDLKDCTEEFKDGNSTMLVSRKAYNLVNAKGKVTTLTINDSRIISAIESFKSAETMDRLSMYIKAKSLAKMSDCMNVIQNMGFKTVGKFAHHVLGISELTANQYARVGRYFLKDDFMPLDCFPANMEVTKLLEFLPYVVNDKGEVDTVAVQRLYANGDIVDGMSQSKLRDALKAAFKALPAGETESKSKSESKSESKSKSDSKSKTESEPNFIDTIESMDKMQAAAAALSALDIVRKIVDKFATFDDSLAHDSILTQLENVADVVRKFAE